MSARAVSTRYAKALVDVVLEQKNHERVLQELAAIKTIYQESLDLRQTIVSPAITAEQKQAILGAIYDRAEVSATTGNFVNLLLKNYRLVLIAKILEAFQQEIDLRLGFVTVDLTSACELSAGERAILANKLEAVTGKKVRARFHTDPSLIAGVVARIGSMVYDGSVSTKLKKFEAQLGSAE